MPIGLGIPLQVVVRGTYLGQQVQVGQWYETDGAAFLTATPEAVGNAYWQHIKVAFRALLANAVQVQLESVYVAEDGATGAYGEYPIPPAEKQGTRVISTLNDLMPPFAAGGVRLTVGSRVTRPGQKRMFGLYESDSDNGGYLGSVYRGLLGAVAAYWSAPITLGAPVATGVLTPIVTRRDPNTGLITDYQPVTGFLVKDTVTTQNSRKYGHGA